MRWRLLGMRIGRSLRCRCSIFAPFHAHARQGISVSIIEPGTIHTNMTVTHLAAALSAWQQAFPSVPADVLALYDGVVAAFDASFHMALGWAVACDETTVAIVDALTAARPQPRYLVGWDARLLSVAR